MGLLASNFSRCRMRSARHTVYLNVSVSVVFGMVPAFCMNGPALLVRPDDSRSAARPSDRDQPEDLFGHACAREAHVQGAARPDPFLPGIHHARADLPIQLRAVEGVGAPPPTQIPPLVAGWCASSPA